ncbi:hypothetical protein TB2_007626 [Malus domestica]
MYPTKQKHQSFVAEHAEKCSRSEDSITSTAHRIFESVHGGSLRHMDLTTGTNGWASPSGDLFSLRTKNYLSKKQKSPAGDYLLQPCSIDWLRSSTKLKNVLVHPDNRMANTLRKAQSQGKSLKSFIFTVNLQIPSKDQHIAVFYFTTEDPIPAGLLLYQFVNGDDAFQNYRFKIVKGSWIVEKTVGNYSACLLGKALTCNYHRGPNYVEIDVDIVSSGITKAILRLALRYVTSVMIDMGFMVEAHVEDELPEKLVGAVRVCEMEMLSVTVMEALQMTSLGTSSCW